MDLSELDIPPYIMDVVVSFWYELRLDIPSEKRKILKKTISSSKEAPPNNDFTDMMSGLMALIFLYDAAYALDDYCLKRLAAAALRERLTSMKYDSTEYFEAMDEAYKRMPNCEKNRNLRRIFLIICHLRTFSVHLE